MAIPNERDAISSSGTSKMLCVVLSFNGCADTLACLESITRQQPAGLDVLVVDNASATGVFGTLQAAYPTIEMVGLPKNLGWAGGNNIGIQIGLDRGYQWICLLNNDTVFPDGEVANWIAAVKYLPPCLLHPSIYYWDEPEIAQLNPGADGRLESDGQSNIGSGNISMTYAYGACLAIHRDVINDVGLFDERFFLQLEETDFYLRSVKKGYQAICNPSVKIFHKESRAFGGTRAPIKTYYSVRNTFLLIEKKKGDLRSKWKDLKGLYWSLSTLAAATQGRARFGGLDFMQWIMSSAASAKAVRFGLRDYLLRRFGKITDTSHERLKCNEIVKTTSRLHDDA